MDLEIEIAEPLERALRNYNLPFTCLTEVGVVWSHDHGAMPPRRLRAQHRRRRYAHSPCLRQLKRHLSFWNAQIQILKESRLLTFPGYGCCVAGSELAGRKEGRAKMRFANLPQNNLRAVAVNLGLGQYQLFASGDVHPPKIFCLLRSEEHDVRKAAVGLNRNCRAQSRLNVSHVQRVACLGKCASFRMDR